ncbi:MAG TPA: hypothetical protein VEQ63_06150 [Bryobacteraceae bacterium]|nr:hypothetical protein [Bryobacteraceae bacterium]
MNQNTAATSTSPVTVLLTNHQAAMLDEIAAGVRRDTGGVLSRSAMIRAVLSAVIPPTVTSFNVARKRTFGKSSQDGSRVRSK